MTVARDRPQNLLAPAERIALIRENVPTELLDLDQWVLWRHEFVDGKWPKVPYDAKTLANAGSTDPTTWASFATAAKMYNAGKADGLGFVFSKDDPYCGIDLDDCIVDGVIDPQRLKWARQLNGYTERSQSGTGIHIIVKAKLPGTGRKHTKLNVEIYDRGRFFTMTGDVL